MHRCGVCARVHLRAVRGKPGGSAGLACLAPPLLLHSHSPPPPARCCAGMQAMRPRPSSRRPAAAAHLVPHVHHRQVLHPQLPQNAVHGINLGRGVGVGHIHDVQQQRGIANLFQRRAEGGHQLVSSARVGVCVRACVGAWVGGRGVGCMCGRARGQTGGQAAPEREGMSPRAATAAAPGKSTPLPP